MSETKDLTTPVMKANDVPTTSGSTPNYGLPQWEGQDVTNWFQFNPAFAKIDETMKQNADRVTTAQETGDSNTASISNLTQAMNQLTTRMTNAENINNQQTQQITLNTTHLNEHDTSIANAETAIEQLQKEAGDTSGEVASLEADVSELKLKMTTAQLDISQNADNIGNMSDLKTSQADTLVNAINSLTAGGSVGIGWTTLPCMLNSASDKSSATYEDSEYVTSMTTGQDWRGFYQFIPGAQGNAQVYIPPSGIMQATGTVELTFSAPVSHTIYRPVLSANFHENPPGDVKFEMIGQNTWDVRYVPYTPTAEETGTPTVKVSNLCVYLTVLDKAKET